MPIFPLVLGLSFKTHLLKSLFLSRFLEDLPEQLQSAKAKEMREGKDSPIHHRVLPVLALNEVSSIANSLALLSSAFLFFFLT